MRDPRVGHLWDSCRAPMVSTGGRCRRSATGWVAHPERARFVPEAASHGLAVLVTTP